MSFGQFELHRLQSAVDERRDVDLRRPHSNFALVQELFGDSPTMSRLFSIARSPHDCVRCVIEKIDDKGLLAADTEELCKWGYKCSPENLRLSFWGRDGRLAGYVIARNDNVDGGGCKWYVFESVFRKYPHDHNCVAHTCDYRVMVNDAVYSVRGVMFCQQNGRNKRCAQVALRALFSRLPSCNGLSYAQINEIASRFPGEVDENGKFHPRLGLSAAQIEGVLGELGLRCKSINYAKESCDRAEEWAKTVDWRGKSEGEKKEAVDRRAREENLQLHKTIRYGRVVYCGAESGLGALIGLRVFDGKRHSLHIVPIFGHTFNQDSWVPDSQKYYFVSSDPEEDKTAGSWSVPTAYIQSDNWTSSFIGHDDNLGSDYCIPRAYLKPSNVAYVVELLSPGAVYSGVVAEAIGLVALRNLMQQVDATSVWMMRLISAYASGDVILRSLCVSPTEYYNHLQTERDWSYRQESLVMTDGFRRMKHPEKIWVVEISLPQLFPANKRKLGEIVLDATNEKLEPSMGTESEGEQLIKSVLWIRLPGGYYMPSSYCPDDPEQTLHFESAPSDIQSHFPVMRFS